MPSYRYSVLKPSGFTLVELLVAISIIGISFGVIISSATGIQKSGRDTQRQSDLRLIQSALQHYYADQSFFPTSDSTAPGVTNLNSGSTTLTSSIGNPSPPSSIKTYINTLPKDPSSGANYVYKALPITPCDNSATLCQKFCLYANLENPPAGGLPDQCTLTGYNLAITQP